MPTMHPDAIDVTGNTGGGKPWVGGSGKPKLVLHTIEGADYPVLGWPRSGTSKPFSTWTSPPHLAMNAARWPDRDWLYQTVPFNLAGKALRDNAGEDDRYVYQIEVAGLSAKVPDYPDEWYRSLAQVCQWFVDNLGVADVWRDFSCCAYGDTRCRMSRSAMNTYSGFMGHCHFGKGIDTHGDPGRLDVARLRSFMQLPQEDDPMAGFYATEGQVDDRNQRRFFVERIQAWLALLNGGNPDYGNRSLIEGAGMTLGTYDPRTVALVAEFTGTAGVGIGPTEERRLLGLLEASNHSHIQYAVDGHTHQGYSLVTHSHPFTGNTDGADS